MTSSARLSVEGATVVEDVIGGANSDGSDVVVPSTTLEPDAALSANRDGMNKHNRIRRTDLAQRCGRFCTSEGNQKVATRDRFSASRCHKIKRSALVSPDLKFELFVFVWSIPSLYCSFRWKY